MDSDLGAMLSSVLSDPEQMAKLTQAARSLMGAEGGGEIPSAPPQPPAAPAGAAGTGDAGILSALGKVFGQGAGASRSTALLVAMRPYMRPEKQEKLDRAMKIAQMARIAGAVMREYGGGHGV